MEHKPKTTAYATPDIDPEFNATFCERLGKFAQKATKTNMDGAPDLSFLPHAPQSTPDEGSKACHKPADNNPH